MRIVETIRRWRRARACGTALLFPVTVEPVCAREGLSPRLMSREKADAVAASLFPCAGSVRFAGCADPLLNDSLAAMLRAARAHGASTAVETPGSLLDEARDCELIGAGLGSLLLPIPEPPPGGELVTGTIAWNLRVLARVKRKLGTRAPEVAVVAPLPPPGGQPLKPLFEFARRIGAGVLAFDPPAGGNRGTSPDRAWADRQREAAAIGLELRLCGTREAPSPLALTVDVEGNLLRGDRAHRPAGGEDIPPFGNLMRTPLREIILGDEFRAFLDSLPPPPA